MANLKLNHIYKVYENGTKAVSDFNIDIKDKEFIVFVGPSGCGKSTTLRMIAGLEDITAGDLFIDDKLVNNLEPKDRDCAMVFQNYALYPHMSVYENMAFGLRIAKVNKHEIDERVKEAARILDITEYLDKRPKEMSGGQRQRVALGRAIVRKPKVFLLDEPLSNLDAKLRATMRTEITKLHQRLQTTFIYVTHDQVEAMTMGTRIVVMKKGLVQQIDTPKNLYDYPVNKFVAGFIGTPQMNFYDVKLNKIKNNVIANLGGLEIKIPYEKINKIDISYLNNLKDVVLGIRAEHISNVANGSTPIKVIPNVIEELGSQVQVNATIKAINKDIVFTLKDSNAVELNKEMTVYFDYNKLNFFDKENEETIMKRIPDVNKVKATVLDHQLTIFNKTIELPKALEVLENGEYDLEIPLKALIKGNTYKLKILNKEIINNVKLVSLKSNDQVIFGFSNENNEFSFDIELEQVKFYKDNVLVKDCLDEYNLYYSHLVRIKDVYNNKKVTGFKFNIENQLIDVPAMYYEKTLAVLNKKFELHNIEFKFDKYQGSIGKTGIKLELLETYDYGSKVFGLFKMGETKIIHQIKKIQKEYYLDLKFSDLKVRDTYFDIQLF